MELTVWQRAHDLALLVHRVTEKFPRSARFGMVMQMRRAAYSIAANIAEGFGRGTTRELLQSLKVARGSTEEVRYFLILSSDLGHLSQELRGQGFQKCDSVGQLINALGRSLKGRLSTSHKSRVTSHG